MPSDIMSGKKILKYEKKQMSGSGHRTPDGWPLTSLTPRQMAEAIRKKYGKVKKKGRYYHRGDGEVTKHSSSRDRKRQSRRDPKYRGDKRHKGDYR